MPLIASVGVMSNFFMQSNSRQKPTRMPYSCHAQLGRSGSNGCAIAGAARCAARPLDSPILDVDDGPDDHARAAGKLEGGRSTIAE